MKVMYGIMLFFLGGSAGLYLISAESRCSVVYLICFFLQVVSAIVYLILLHKEKKFVKQTFLRR